MSDLMSGKSPVAHNAAKGGAAKAPADGHQLPYGVARNANDFRNLKSDGRSVTPTANAGQMSATLTQEINAPAMCQFVYHIDANWTQADFDQFKPGSKLEIQNQDIQAAELAPLYVSGISLDASAGESTHSALTVTAFDRMHFMRFGAYTAAFVQKNDAAIFRWLANSADLKLDASGLSDDSYPYVLQDNETCYDFLLRRCAQGEYECMVVSARGLETLVVGRRRYDDTPAQTLVYNHDIVAINLDMRAPTLGSTVAAWGYDVIHGKPVMGSFGSNSPEFRMKGKQTAFEAAKPFGSSPVMLRRPDLIDERSLGSLAGAERGRLQDTFVEGSATLKDLDLKATPGTIVAIDGLSGTFNGLYQVVKSTHRIERGRNFTVLNLRRSGM